MAMLAKMESKAEEVGVKAHAQQQNGKPSLFIGARLAITDAVASVMELPPPPDRSELS